MQKAISLLRYTAAKERFIHTHTKNAVDVRALFTQHAPAIVAQLRSLPPGTLPEQVDDALAKAEAYLPFALAMIPPSDDDPGAEYEAAAQLLSDTIQ